MPTTTNWDKVLDDMISGFKVTPGLNKVTWERDELVNQLPDRAPWGGLYKRRRRLEPRTLGAGSSSRMENADLIVILQASNINSGAEAADELEDMIKRVLDALIAEPTIKGRLDMVNDIEVEYLYELGEEPEQMYFQSAMLVINAEVNTQ